MLSSLASRSLRTIFMPYYAVARGYRVCVVETWPECEKHVKGFKGARFKKFDNLEDANAFVETNRASSSAAFAPKTATKIFNTSSLASVTKSFKPGTSAGALKRTHASTVGIPDGTSSEDLNDAEDDSGPSKRFASVNGVGTNSQGPIVYTDGACSSNGRYNARAGYGIFWGDGHKNNLAAPLKGPATNNRAEYTAVIVALKQAIKDGHSHITIKTDSNLLIQSMTKWLRGWKRNNFKTGQGKPVLNADLIMELDKLMENICVKFEHVNGHVGIYGNEMADQLARQGAEKVIRE
ncbi:RNase H domain-containing protein [Ditylenchus destructor]|uniref:Ribonuclease H1 n=1 Tax=Ditylenchus destructor TaxID=166010 RepID=A0AAD4R9S0_9BILA|nr:RNase H domain-containing protein [Ditylenchus destructor]